MRRTNTGRCQRSEIGTSGHRGEVPGRTCQRLSMPGVIRLNMKIGIAGSGLFAGGSFQSNEFMAGVSSEGEDIARTCRKAAVPLALMHQFRWRALSSRRIRGRTAPGIRAAVRSSRPSTGKANNISPGALTRIGLRACSSAKARLTLRCSSLPNRAEFAGECAAFICRTFFYWARSWNTESPKSFR